MNELIATLFLSREIAHRDHLKTKSYAQHKALQGFYEEIVDLTDDLVELYQGRYGIIDNIPILTESKKYREPVYCIADKLKYVETKRYEAVPKQDTAIQNKIDEIVGLYLSTIYKLENLK